MSTGKKRNVVEMFFEEHVIPSAEHLKLLMGVRKDELEGDLYAKPTTSAGALVKKLLKVESFADLAGRPFLVPTQLPDEKDAWWDWDFLGSSNFACFVVEADAAEDGGGLYIRRIGNLEEQPSEVDLEWVDCLCLPESPTSCLIAVVPDKGVRTAMERKVDGYLRAYKDSHDQKSLHLQRASNSPATKDGMYHVLDLNDVQHRVSSRSAGYDRMVDVGGFIREMLPERFQAFCKDLVFDAPKFFSKCFQLRDEDMQSNDVNLSIQRMQMLEDREVYLNLRKFSAAMLGKWNILDVEGVSLKDFRRPHGEQWGSSATYRGRADLLDAMEMWGSFQRIFKGEAFADCIKPVRDLWERKAVMLKQFNNDYLQSKLESLVRVYYEEVFTVRGQFSRLYPQQPLAVQADCVALLNLLVNDLVKDAETPGTWERAPHSVFYGVDGYYHFVKTNRSRATSGSAGALTEPGTAVSAWTKAGPPCHKKGLCMWHLAGQLGLKDATGKTFKCRDKSYKHTMLKKVFWETARDLAQDQEFMGVCVNPVLCERVINVVEDNKQAFH